MKNIKDCPFCNILKDEREILSETKYSFVILSNPALISGHCLAIPKRHIEKLSELTKRELFDLIEHTTLFQNKLLTKYGGCDIRQNYRPFQKQDGFKVNHLHIHLQPMEFKDGLYKKCQIYESLCWKTLTKPQLKKMGDFILK